MRYYKRTFYSKTYINVMDGNKLVRYWDVSDSAWWEHKFTYYVSEQEIATWDEVPEDEVFLLMI